jgi:serine acetyltransferase
MWASRVSIGILLYRVERGCFLLMGRTWSVLRIPFLPLLNLLYAYSNCEINYHASIGPGLLVLHVAPGIVISGKATVGKNLTLVGGNIIGGRQNFDSPFKIGNDCTLGANAVILGPLVLGDNIVIGACSLVLQSYPSGQVLVGSPAKPIQNDTDPSIYGPQI